MNTNETIIIVKEFGEEGRRLCGDITRKASEVRDLSLALGAYLMGNRYITDETTFEDFRKNVNLMGVLLNELALGLSGTIQGSRFGMGFVSDLISSLMPKQTIN